MIEKYILELFRIKNDYDFNTEELGFAEYLLGVANVELGLRWLNDRTAESRHRAKSRGWQDPSGRWFG
jgi:hypothetical protein